MDSLQKSPPPKQFFPPQENKEYFPRISSPFNIPPKAFPFPQKKAKKSHLGRKIFFTIFIVLLFVVLGAAAFLFSKSLSVEQSIQIQNTVSPSLFSDIKRLAVSFLKETRKPLSGEDTGRINILLLGRAGEHSPGKNLTDTIMIMSIDTTNKKVALLSLPRDLYVPIPDTNLYTKINSLYQYGLSQNDGINPLRTSVENVIGQTINYFFILDFDGFEKTVDALSGIKVDVLRDFYDPLYPGKNYSYETFAIKKGWQTLDGTTALKYVRERHNDPEGDFGRAKRQQQVIQAIKDKAFSLGTFFNVFTVNNLLNTLGESVKTDMGTDDLEGLLKLIKTLDTENVSSVVVDAWKPESLLRVSHIQVGPTAAFILVPRVGNWSEIRDVSDNIFRLDTIAARRAHISEEQPTLTLLFSPEDIAVAQKMKQLITEQMNFPQVSLLPSNMLENQREQSIIIDRSALKKPYSLDELLKKFTLKKETVLPLSLPSSDTSDFVIAIGDDLVEALSFDEENISAITNDTSFSEPFQPQEKPGKKKH